MNKKYLAPRIGASQGASLGPDHQSQTDRRAQLFDGLRAMTAYFPDGSIERLALTTAATQLEQMIEAKSYAQRLAVCLWERHWKTDAPDWKPLPDLLGLLTQIDNSTAGLERQIERDDEHYAAAMAMSEKHRKSWVEACQERDRLAEQLKQTGAAQ